MHNTTRFIMPDRKKRPPEIGREQARISLDVIKLIGHPLNQLTAAKLFDGSTIEKLGQVTKDGDDLCLELVVKITVKK